MIDEPINHNVAGSGTLGFGHVVHGVGSFCAETTAGVSANHATGANKAIMSAVLSWFLFVITPPPVCSMSS